MAASDQAPRRPRYLSFMLLVGWLTGLLTLHEGYVTLRVLGDPLAADTLGLPSAVGQAVVDAMGSNSTMMLPVAAAQMVAGGFLLATCASTLFGLLRRVGWCVQAVLLNLVVAVVGHALRAPVQDALVSAMARAPEFVGRFTEAAAPADLQAGLEWGVRLAFFAQVLALLGLLWGLSRRSVRDFLSFSPTQPRES